MDQHNSSAASDMASAAVAESAADISPEPNAANMNVNIDAPTIRSTESAASSDTSNRQYRAICFDLDGTLLPMDIDKFLHSYFSRIGAFAEERGLDKCLFMSAFERGAHAMGHHDDGELNSDIFWDAFERIYCEGMSEQKTADTLARAHKIADEFYEDEFKHIGDGFVPDPASARVVKTLAEKGYPLALTTMPMFPKRAVEHRLGWAGIDPSSFARITTYMNSRSTKPHLAYFAENLKALGLKGEDVLMVGNNTLEDLRFMELGADAFLITDYLLDPIGYDLNMVKHGSMEDFERWVNELPPCAHPATDITDEAVSVSVSECAD